MFSCSSTQCTTPEGWRLSMKKLLNAQRKLLTVETVTKALIVQFQFIWRYNSVLSFTQNSWNDSAVSRRATGILFQLSGPEMANARGPSVFVRYAGTTKSPCAAERRWRRPGSLETDLIMSIKYDGASPCRHLCTRAHVLNWILWCTGSQWSSSRMAVEMWSYFRIRRIRRAVIGASVVFVIRYISVSISIPLLAMYFNSVSIIVLQCISVSISIRQVFQFQFCFTSVFPFLYQL